MVYCSHINDTFCEGGAALDPKELTSKELEEVAKAMQEFATGSWAPSPKKIPKKPRKVSLPVNPILIISVALFVLVALMVVIAILPKAETSTPTDPPAQTCGSTATQATQHSTGSTELITPPILPSSEATEASTQAPTQVTKEPTQATEEPTKPPVKVPNGTLLSDSEHTALQMMFAWPSLYASVSPHSFSDPAELNLPTLIGEKAVDQTSGKLTDKERAYLATISEDFLYLDTYRVSKTAAARIVEQYYGLNLDDIPSAQTSVYWEETDSYYFIQDTNFCQLNITHAVGLVNGNIWVRYEDILSDRTGEMILHPTDTDYQILSNQTTG